MKFKHVKGLFALLLAGQLAILVPSVKVFADDEITNEVSTNTENLDVDMDVDGDDNDLDENTGDVDDEVESFIITVIDRYLNVDGVEESSSVRCESVLSSGEEYTFSALDTEGYVLTSDAKFSGVVTEDSTLIFTYVKVADMDETSNDGEIIVEEEVTEEVENNITSNVAPYVTGEHTVKFTFSKYSIYGNEVELCAAQTVADGGYVVEPDFTTLPEWCQDYTFLFWYTFDGETMTKWDFATDTVTDDITLHLQLISLTPVIFTDPAYSTGLDYSYTVGPDSCEAIERGEFIYFKVDFPTPPEKEGYEFECWYTPELDAWGCIYEMLDGTEFKNFEEFNIRRTSGEHVYTIGRLNTLLHFYPMYKRIKTPDPTPTPTPTSTSTPDPIPDPPPTSEPTPEPYEETIVEETYEEPETQVIEVAEEQPAEVQAIKVPVDDVVEEPKTGDSYDFRLPVFYFT